MTDTAYRYIVSDPPSRSSQCETVIDDRYTNWRLAYENYSLWGVTDPNAPVQASGEIVIAAESRRVWAILTDVNSWPELRSDIDRVVIDGPLAQGATCVRETARISLRLNFGLLVAPREINWTTATASLVMTNRMCSYRRGDQPE